MSDSRDKPLDTPERAPRSPESLVSDEPRAAQPAEPRILAGRYRLREELGRGGMGRVFAARDLTLDRDVAVKLLPTGMYEPADDYGIEREARVAGSLGHPNVVVVHDVGRSETGPYMVSELLEGETLRARLSGKPLRLSKALDFAVQLARGLAAAHEKGLVHRDIKPENLFITRGGTLKILDFGIAKALAQERPVDGPPAPPGDAPAHSSSVRGTLGYMSPEQVRGKPADSRSDIFAAGVVLYEMVSGRRPFTGTTPVEIGLAISKGEPAPLPADVPAELERLIWRCLEKDPADRFQSARDLAFDLEALLSKPQRRAPPAPPRRRWTTLAALWALSLVAVVFAVSSILRKPRGTPGTFRQITFTEGAVEAARFAPDGETVVYSVMQNRAPELFSLRLSAVTPRPLGLGDANLLAVSDSAEIALLVHPRFLWWSHQLGTLGRVSLGGGTVREIQEGIQFADWGPGNELAVVRKEGSRTRLEFPPRTVLYQTTGWIGEPRFSPRRDLIAFLDHPDASGNDEGSVAVVDLSGKVKTLAGGWKSARGLAWSPSGKEIWFTAAAADTPFAQNIVRAVDLSGRQRVLAQTTGRLMLQDVSRDGKVLVTEPNPSLGLAFVSDSAPEEKELSWLEAPILYDISADGSAVLFTEIGSAAEPAYAMFVRKVDGSPPLALGSGLGAAFSPDGKWVISLPPPTGQNHAIRLVPIGAGESRALDTGGVTVVNARWLPGGKRLVLAGAEPGRAPLLYLQATTGGKPRAISEEGVSTAAIAVSPDGAFVAALGPDAKAHLYPVEGGVPRPIPTAEADEAPVGFANDGSLFLRSPRERLPAKIWRIDLAQGARTPWKTLAPGRPGVTSIGRIFVTPDARAFAYNYSSTSAHLFVLEGVE